MRDSTARLKMICLVMTTILASFAMPISAISKQPKDLSPYALASEAHMQPPSGEWLYFPFPFDATVNDIWVDDHGGVWLATSVGLALFDGDEFTMFFEGLDLHTVGGDNKGHLVASNSFGRAHFFKESSFETYGQIQVVPESDMADPYSGRRIENVLMDSKGNTWFACLFAGLARYDGERLEWVEQSRLPSTFEDVVEDQDGTVWIGGYGDSWMKNWEFGGTRDQVAAYREDGTWENYECLDGESLGNNVIGLSVDQQNHVWAVDDTPFVFMFDGVKWTAVLWSHPSTDCCWGDIWAYTFDDVWVGGHWGLFQYDGTEWWTIAKTTGGWGFMRGIQGYDHRTYFSVMNDDLAGDQQGVVYITVNLLDSDYRTILESGLLAFVPSGAELRHYTPPETPIEEPSTSLRTLIVRKEGLITSLENPSGIYFLDFPIPAPGYDETSAHQLVDYLNNQQKLYEDGSLTIDEQDSLARQTAAFERFVCQEDITSQVYPHYASVSSDVVHSILEIVMVGLSFSKAVDEVINQVAGDIPYIRQLMIKQNQKMFDFLDSLYDVIGNWIEDEQDREAWDRAWTAIFTVVQASVGSGKGILDALQEAANVVGAEVVLGHYVDSTQSALESGAERVRNSDDQQFFENNVHGPASAIDNQTNLITQQAKMEASSVHDMREGLDEWADWGGLARDIGNIAQDKCVPCAIGSVLERLMEVGFRVYDLLWLGFPTIDSLGDLPYTAEHYCFDTTTLYGAQAPSHIDCAHATRSMSLSHTAINRETAQYLAQQGQALQQAISEYQKVQSLVIDALQRNDTETATNLIPDLMKAEETLAAQFRVSRGPILASAAHLRDADSALKYKQVGHDALNYDGQISMFYVHLTDCLMHPENVESCQTAIVQAEEVDRAILAYQQSIEALESAVASVPLSPNVLLAGYSAEGLHVDLQVTNASPLAANGVMVTMEGVAPVAIGDLGGGETKLVAFDIPTPGAYVAKVEAEGSDPDTLFVWVSETHSEEAGSTTGLASNILLGVGGVFLCTSLFLVLLALWMRRNAKR